MIAAAGAARDRGRRRFPCAATRRRSESAPSALCSLRSVVAFSALLFMLRARAPRSGDQPGQSVDIARTLAVRDRTAAVRRAGPVAARGAGLAAGRQLVRVRRLAVRRCRSAPTVIPTRGARRCHDRCSRALGVVGARWHRRIDRRGWRAVAAAVRLRIARRDRLPQPQSRSVVRLDDSCRATRHEARDRDYFFVLGFWAWGIWAGMGAIALARRLRAARGAIGVRVAALPIALNWSAVNRRSEPEASLPREVASALLDRAAAARRAVRRGRQRHLSALVRAAGRANPSRRHRRDAAAACAPAGTSTSWRDATVCVAADEASRGRVARARSRPLRAAGRPVAVAVTVPSATVTELADRGRLSGRVLLATTSG